MYMYMYMYMHMPSGTLPPPSVRVALPSSTGGTCIHARMHTCVHAYMDACTHARVLRRMHTCVHTGERVPSHVDDILSHLAPLQVTDGPRSPPRSPTPRSPTPRSPTPRSPTPRSPSSRRAVDDGDADDVASSHTASPSPLHAPPPPHAPRPRVWAVADGYTWHNSTFDAVGFSSVLHVYV